MDFKSRIFTLEDQIAFARLSGDWNVMHVDPVAARRTQAGAPAVHGVHNFLWAMELAVQAGCDLSAFSTFKIEFLKFVLVGMPCTYVLTADADRFKLDVASGGSVALRITAKAGAPAMKPFEGFADLPPRALTAAQDRTMEQMQGEGGWLIAPDGADPTRLFPTLSAYWGPEKVQSVALLSTVVGMAVPGLHSIFSGLKIQFGGAACDRLGLGYRCIRVDERFRLVALVGIANGLSAEVSAFVRQPPVQMQGTADLLNRTGLDFSGRHALIIGGSRGLGEATAKLFAAAGGNVTITYAQGRADAEAVAADIRATCGAGAAAIMHYDTACEAPAQLARLAAPPTHVYYFATGRIGNRVAGAFDEAAFARYADIYLAAFARLCAALPADIPIGVLWPSSVFVTDRPAGLTEYAMAKAAGETLCRDLGSAYPRLTIRAPRLPRVLTDQTAGVVPVETEDAVATMTRVLRGDDFAR